MLEKTLESPLDGKEIKPVNPKRNQPWIFIGRTGVEAEAPILWPPDVNSQLFGKDSHAEKDWGQEEKGMTEDEMVGWHPWLNGHWASSRIWRRTEKPGCCSPWGHKGQIKLNNWTITDMEKFLALSFKTSLLTFCSKLLFQWWNYDLNSLAH